jgi:hypothetical protein
MKQPTQRYGCRTELAYFLQFTTIPELARQLRRSEKIVKMWADGKQPVPWWVIEILRLREMRRQEMARQMTHYKHHARLGVVRGSVIEFPNIYRIQENSAKRRKLENAAQNLADEFSER